MSEPSREWTVMVCPCGGLLVPALPEEGGQNDWYCPDEDDVLLRGQPRPVRVCPVSERDALAERVRELEAALKDTIGDIHRRLLGDRAIDAPFDEDLAEALRRCEALRPIERTGENPS